ncbi:hypothetical protein [Streptomyces sp. NPDC088350]|uniref:hypothetical protein n=1 Tax=Streptomyces sp. NPDC088350 TaxID=3365854 RepID=UPI00380CE53F
MSRKPPANIVGSFTDEGALHLEWDLDRFFPDPEEPDNVWVELPHGIATPIMDGSVRSADLPKAALQPYAGTLVTGDVVFKWNGPPDDVQAGAFQVVVPGGGSPGNPEPVPRVPVLGLVDRQPRTLGHENLITISWASYSYTSGTIFWGPDDQPRHYSHGIDASGARYSGTFTTDHPLRPRTPYRFLVQVTNAFEHRTVEARITVESAANFTSVRQFLAASGVHTPTGLRRPLGRVRGLRAAMG